uniref:Uncharacterized protein n=1 Tax=Cannabis sativa TaxID=3483 RepID=A0A803NWW6_CANSA
MSRIYFVCMAKTKQTLSSTHPYDPHVVRVATRVQVRMVEETSQPRADVEPEIDQGAESSDTKFDLEDATPVRRRRYRTCSVLPDCPLGRYDANGNPLNRLGEPSELGLDHLTLKSIKYLWTMFVVYMELGWPQPTPYEIGYYFDLKSAPKQNRTGVAKVLVVKGDIEHEVPLSRIAQNLERKDRALSRCLAGRGPIGDVSLWIRPRGQVSEDLLAPCLESKARRWSRTLIVPLLMTMAERHVPVGQHVIRSISQDTPRTSRGARLAGHKACCMLLVSLRCCCLDEAELSTKSHLSWRLSLRRDIE